jgi:hypothetical protein
MKNNLERKNSWKNVNVGASEQNNFKVSKLFLVMCQSKWPIAKKKTSFGMHHMTSNYHESSQHPSSCKNLSQAW